MNLADSATRGATQNRSTYPVGAELIVESAADGEHATRVGRALLLGGLSVYLASIAVVDFISTRRTLVAGPRIAAAMILTLIGVVATALEPAVIVAAAFTVLLLMTVIEIVGQSRADPLDDVEASEL